MTMPRLTTDVRHGHSQTKADLRRGARFSTVLIAVVFASQARIAAAAEREPRFNLVTAQLRHRLTRQNAAYKRNLDAVAHYRRADGRVGGSAFLISAADKDGRALVLTNHHVALFEKDTVAGDSVLFSPGEGRRPRPARIEKCLAADPELDYALLSVQLHGGLRRLQPAETSTFFEPKTIYNVAFPRIWSAEKKRRREGLPSLIATNRRSKGDFEKALRRRKHLSKTIQSGRENPEFQVPALVALRLANENGSSGSPIYDRTTHHAIGLLAAGAGNDLAFAVPLGLIAQDLKRKLAASREPELEQALLRWKVTSPAGGQGADLPR
jgi:hypothetical protein